MPVLVSLATTLLLVFTTPIYAREAPSISIAAGPTSGLYYQTAAYICEVIKKDAKVPCSVIITEGSQKNLQLINSSKATFALIQENVAKDLPPAQTIKPLYNEYLMLLLNKDFAKKVKSLQDLEGASYYAGRHTGVYGVIEDVKKAFNLGLSSREELGGYSSQKGLDMLCNNDINFKFVISGQPIRMPRELSLLCDIQLHSLTPEDTSKLLNINKYYQAAVIPRTLYRTPKDVRTVSMRVLLVARAGVSPLTKKRVLTTLDANKDLLREANPHLSY